MIDVTSAYARRAGEYASMLGSVDAAHPDDRHLIEAWGDAASGLVIDAGCGPGHWTQHLASRGANVRGIDVVPEFIAHARASYPGVRFDLESIEAIDEADAGARGILSWFSTIHHAPSRIAVPLAEFARVLAPGATLLLGYFDGDAVEAFDHRVVRAYRWPAAELHARLGDAGLEVVETHRRAPRSGRPVGAIICQKPRTDSHSP